MLAVEMLTQLNRELTSDEMLTFLAKVEPIGAEYVEYKKFDDTRYARNQVATGNHFELILMCWKAGQESSIHDHGTSLCAVKVLEGTATERIYRRVGAQSVALVEERKRHQGTVFMDSDAGVHRIANTSLSDEPLVTLHLYSPPLSMSLYSE